MGIDRLFVAFHVYLEFQPKRYPSNASNTDTMSIAQNPVSLPEADDREAWNTLVKKYEPSLLALARQFPLNEVEVQDAIQCTWIRLLERHTTVRNPNALTGWLRTVCRNECLNRLRHSKRTRCADPGDFAKLVTPRPQDCPDEIAVQNCRRAALEQALQELRPVVRSVVVGSVVEKRPYRELETMLGVPGGSIGPTRMRALKRLRTSPQLKNLLAAS